MTDIDFKDITKELKYMVKEYRHYPHVRLNPSMIKHKNNIYYGVYRLLVHYRYNKKYNILDAPPM